MLIIVNHIHFSYYSSFPIKIDFLQPKQIKTGTIIMKYLFFVLCGSKQKTIFVPIFV